MNIKNPDLKTNTLIQIDSIQVNTEIVEGGNNQEEVNLNNQENLTNLNTKILEIDNLQTQVNNLENSKLPKNTTVLNAFSVNDFDTPGIIKGTVFAENVFNSNKINIGFEVYETSKNILFKYDETTGIYEFTTNATLDKSDLNSFAQLSDIIVLKNQILELEEKIKILEKKLN